MKVLGQPILIIIWIFSLSNLLKSMQIVHWKNFIIRGFSLLGEFIIGGSTVIILAKRVSSCDEIYQDPEEAGRIS